MPDQPKDYPAEKGTPIDRQEWQEVAHGVVKGMTPADKGWILAFVMLFAIFQISNYLMNRERIEQSKVQSNNLVTYFTQLEGSRSTIEENRAQEIRRLQEVVKELSQALGRQYEYMGRAQHERSILDKGDKP